MSIVVSQFFVAIVDRRLNYQRDAINYNNEAMTSLHTLET